ncbi:SIS domain-containing protein (plasmid) [Agrobacterium tumefaciens]|uniref:SIS domain-containing protein n=1 Tax=Agrobacterium tumefaciens TaxID=358 RepID=A0AAJ4TDJ9_AGRTU|nr:SIS domain-containing protein [Agrobacterium tumefaciens]
MAEQLAPTIKQLKDVADFGRVTFSGINQVVFVSAGAGLAIGRSLKRYTDEVGEKLRYTVYASAAFVSLARAKPSTVNDANTVVILSSKSGATPETVAAAESLKGKACKTVVFTKSEDAELASFGHKAFFTGNTTQAFHATHMLMTAFLGGILAARENWTLLPTLLSSLEALPTDLFHAASKGVLPGKEFAAGFAPHDPLYFVASGSAEIVPHAFGLCVLQERFGFDIHTVDGGDFFHSVVETVRPGTQNHYILIIPADVSRPEMLDIKTFFERQSKKKEVSFQVIDTNEFDMSGIDPQLRGILGPMLAEAFLKPWAPALAKAAGKSMNDPLVHMGKFAYYSCHSA